MGQVCSVENSSLGFLTQYTSRIWHERGEGQPNGADQNKSASSKTLYTLWKQLPGRHSLPNQTRSAMEQLRDLLLRLSDDSHRYCTFQSEPLVPWTNHATERVIGRMKMRARTVRGDKSWPGMHSGLLLAACNLA